MKIEHTHRKIQNGVAINLLGFSPKVYKLVGSSKQGKYLVTEPLSATNYFVNLNTKKVSICNCYAQIEIDCNCIWEPVILTKEWKLKLAYMIRKANIEKSFVKDCAEVR